MRVSFENFTPKDEEKFVSYNGYQRTVQLFLSQANQEKEREIKIKE